MTSFFKAAILGAVASLVIGSAVQAADINVTFRMGEGGSPHRFVDADEGDDGFDRRERREERTERRERFHEPEGHFRHGRSWPPAAGYPVFARPGWARHQEECRVIVKRRFDRWGDMVVRRIRICD